ncbi:ribosome small subunit-dependent GTPase A [Gynuella sunshinyii]|uniref:Small ribosomal subunit biogenesis GTPase RsgA n=1 Tax=Gynuella sunshinyii YC6258 TaxID=1445510 RepID=A0A0C5VS91_9GAMM|nr:ribosome small subunit-dependent GTPase A [Gynuella sunshinyii]AJQ96193.1 putative GTPase [Gynuella sunshinyii YC6258]
MDFSKLQHLGWKSFFTQQLELDEWDQYIPARVISIHRDYMDVLTEDGVQMLRMGKPEMPVSSLVAVGDWLLAEPKQDCLWLYRILERSSLLRRQAAGHRTQEQLLAANVDWLFIVMSLNDDFNLSRIHRYRLIADDAGIEALVVLTKKDLQADSDLEQKLEQWQHDTGLTFICCNARDREDVHEQLQAWLKEGDTAVLLGSSGVGKSTLTNALLNAEVQQIGAIREQDSKGRHTTTSRQLLQADDGFMIIDTPGMREVQLWLEDGQVDASFDDINEVALRCRFRNCRHQGEPGCAVAVALTTGEVSESRWLQYQKLQKEEAFHLRQEAGAAEQHRHSRAFAKMARKIVQSKKDMKKT